MKLMKSALLLSLIVMLSAGCSAGIADELSRYTKPLRSSDYGSLKAKKAEQGKLNALQEQSSATKSTPLSDQLSQQAGNRELISNISYSNKLSNHVDSIAGVADARVFTAQGHAYVALVLDHTGQGMLKSQESGERDIGTRSVLTGPSTSQQSIHNNPFRFFLTVNDTSQLSDRFIRTVTDSVKAKEPSITNVYISANKDFMYYMDELAQLAWAGESLEDYAEQFTILIEHQFFNGLEMPTSIKHDRTR